MSSTVSYANISDAGMHQVLNRTFCLCEVTRNDFQPAAPNEVRLKIRICGTFFFGERYFGTFSNWVSKLHPFRQFGHLGVVFLIEMLLVNGHLFCLIDVLLLITYDILCHSHFFFIDIMQCNPNLRD